MAVGEPTQVPRRLAWWKILLLVIFYPVGLVVLLVWVWRKSGWPSAAKTALTAVLVALLVAAFALGAMTTSRTAGTDPALHTNPPAQPSEPTPESRPTSRAVSADDYDDDWPFTIDHGTVECRNAGAVVFTDPEGVEYAINGTAMDTFPEMVRIDESSIWRENPDDPELRVDISPILDLGLELC